MPSIGIIGVGEIGRAIVEGLCEGESTGEGTGEGTGDAPGGAPVIHLSPRSAATAARLAERYATVRVCAGNQEVADASDVVIIAVRRPDLRQALDGLRVADDKTVINVMAGVSLGELRQTLATKAALVRAIPLPAVRERRSVTVTHPAHTVADALFDRLGGALPVADEAAFNVLSALTGTLTTHYAYLATLASWAAEHGIAPADADSYVRGLFQGVGRSLGEGTRSLQQLAADHETPGGSNERIRTTWFDAANSTALTRALDDLLARLT
ncbi:NAD(P)-binding domain-containing protein [Nonomuraea soli]|uniref:Pyrroline-5-carboxylate reductase n=1 Tax=Nonomuraea soli TaxID=1032476 RepID=A0A7W0CHC4_9ACTN|nr:NAD(P)-binding domain-containing protein [Nonomuraea soli]MBA2891208.1 pyrroline-5-carboxylate reductase [Nonomuraea soli]